MSDIADSKTESKPNSNVSFTGQKLDWITAAAYDRRIKPSHFEIAFIIAQHINKGTGKAFPSEAWIAEAVGVSERTVKRAVKLLGEIRWLNIKRKRTYDPKTKMWKTRNVYSLRFENVQVMLDARTASRLGRRFKHDTGDTFKHDTSVTLTPSEKHLQKRRDSSERGKTRGEVKEPDRAPLVAVVTVQGLHSGRC